MKTMDILSRYCLNDDSINFEILSDQSNFTTGRVNFENENLNIGLPVFTIHGNHDDPSSVDNTSAVDILATANLVNYFGKANIQYGNEGDPHGEVKVRPILIRKGDTKLALYGLGNIRDERMCRLLNRPRGVEWARPTEYESEWVNVFVLHQNRVAHLQGAKNIVKESHLPRWLHMVIWGHEHECITSPWKSHISGGAFSVMQPGSSVATALSEGESKKKHVFMLEMKRGKWRTVKIPLETVRPFTFDSVVLANQNEVNRGNPDSVMEFLTKKVDQMVQQANLDRTERSPELPLVRLRVDYTGFSTINPQVFAQKFVNKVANPQDILMWQKPVRRRDRPGNVALQQMPTAADARLEDLIGGNLTENLRLLSEIELSGALQEYVLKEEKGAIGETVGLALEETAKDAEDHITETNDVDLAQMVLRAIEAAAGRRKEKLVAQKTVSAALQKVAGPVAIESGNAVDAANNNNESDAREEDGVSKDSANMKSAKENASTRAGARARRAPTPKGSSKSAPKVMRTTATKRTSRKKPSQTLDWGDDSDSDVTVEEEEWDSGTSGDDCDVDMESPERKAASKRPTRSTRSQTTRNTRQRANSTVRGSKVPARSAALASLRSGEPAVVSTRATRASQSQAGAGVSKWGALKKK